MRTGASHQLLNEDLCANCDNRVVYIIHRPSRFTDLFLCDVCAVAYEWGFHATESEIEAEYIGTLSKSVPEKIEGSET